MAQKPEEVGSGAKAMMADGLFTRFPKPDFALSLHCSPTVAHGSVAYVEGPALANGNSVAIETINAKAWVDVVAVATALGRKTRWNSTKRTLTIL